MSVKKTLSQQVNERIVREDWKGIVRLIEKAIKDESAGHQDHWLLDRLSAAYYELREYNKALELVQKARELKPDCPLVLWDLAGTLDTLNRPAEAMSVYLEILKLAPVLDRKDFEERPCGEGHRWTMELLTDCLYRIGLCLEHLDRKDEARKVYGDYLAIRAEGLPSMYKEKDVRKRLRALVAGKPWNDLGERIRKTQERLQPA